MEDLGTCDWSKADKSEQLEMARRSTTSQLRRIAREYDWRLHPEPVLGWVMAQKSIDLGSALSAFLNGEPERFNYMPKRDVPAELRDAARVLDNICLRVNSGFYLCAAGRDVSDKRRLKRWLHYQEIDRSEGRRGRWILDEKIVQSLYKQPELPKAAIIQEKPSTGLLRDLLGPVLELGVSRGCLKYLPSIK